MAAPKDATTEHAPITRTNTGGHPRPRKGATAKKRAKQAQRRPEAPAAPAPATKGKKK